MKENKMSTTKSSKKGHHGPFFGGLQHWQVIAVILACYDAFAVNFAYFFALLLRFDFRYSAIPQNYYTTWLNFAPFYTVICLLVFLKLNLYRSVWRFASYSELLRTIVASAVTAIVQVAGTLLFMGRMPISYYIMGATFQFALVLGIRFSYRFVLLVREGSRNSAASSNAVEQQSINVMLIGAGNAGQMILRDIHQSREVNENVCCIIDDNPNKWGRFIDGVKIEGGRDDIFACAEKYHIKRIYLAIPSATAAQKRDILNICKETRCELKQLPGMYQLVTGQVRVSQMRDVSVEDLLGREPIRTDLTEVFQFITGKTVLVTGGGGSIGSELCRQIASHQPKQLIIFDVYENNAYSIQLELRQKYPDLNLEVLIGSVRDSRKMFDLFEKYHP